MNNTIIIYIVAELASLLFMWLAERSKKKNPKKKIQYVFLILSIIPFALLFAMRSGHVGTDYGLYSEAYTNTVEGALTDHQEEWLPIGYKFMTSALGSVFGSDFHPVLAIITISSYILFIVAIWQNSKHPTFSLALLMTFCIHFQLFNQFRQMLAIAITFFAYKYLRDRKMVPYFILIGIAALFHPSVIIMIPIYFLSNIKLSPRVLIVYVAITILLFIGFDMVKEMLESTYYGSVYFGSQYDYAEGKSVLNLIVRVVMFLLVITQYKNVVKEDKNNIKLYMLALFCTLLQIIVTRSYIIARLATVLFIYYVLLLPEVYNAFKNSLRKQRYKIWLLLITIIAMISYQTAYYLSSSGAEGSGYDEYTTVLDEEI